MVNISQAQKPGVIEECLLSASAGQTTLHYPRNARIFMQGDPADTILYVGRGDVLVSVCSKSGRQAVLAMLGCGDFLGEGCLAGQPVRVSSATAVAPTTVLSITRDAMIHLLRDRPDFADRFRTHVLTRKTRTEADLADQYFSSSEQRLARTLLLLAEDADAPGRRVPPLSHEILAGMVGTTRSRVCLFMNKFRKLGFVDYNEQGIRIQKSLALVILRD